MKQLVFGFSLFFFGVILYFWGLHLAQFTPEQISLANKLEIQKKDQEIREKLIGVWEVQKHRRERYFSQAKGDQIEFWLSPKDGSLKCERRSIKVIYDVGVDGNLLIFSMPWKFDLTKWTEEEKLCWNSDTMIWIFRATTITGDELVIANEGEYSDIFWSHQGDLRLKRIK